MQSIPLIPLSLHNDLPRQKSKTEIVALFPKPTFLENITVDSNGNLFVTSLDEGAVYRITSDQQKERYAAINGKLAGIVHIEDDNFLCNGWDDEGIPTVYLLNDKREIITLTHPKDAQFLNGIAALGDGEFLMCDSYRGVLWKYSLSTGEADLWLEHPLLTRSDNSSPMPAANGIKIFDQAVFVSNTERKLLLRIPLNKKTPGNPEIYLDHVNFDDFAIDVDGTIYASTHIYNSLIRISPDKSMSIVADASDGLVGSTAVAFGRTPMDNNCIYVTTNGGLSFPPPEGIEDGKVVKVFVR